MSHTVLPEAFCNQTVRNLLIDRVIEESEHNNRSIRRRDTMTYQTFNRHIEPGLRAAIGSSGVGAWWLRPSSEAATLERSGTGPSASFNLSASGLSLEDLKGLADALIDVWGAEVGPPEDNDDPW
jgi:hypothetical protein